MKNSSNFDRVWDFPHFYVVYNYFCTHEASGLYYKIFMIIIYDRNAIGQYYKTMIVDYDRS